MLCHGCCGTHEAPFTSRPRDAAEKRKRENTAKPRLNYKAWTDPHKLHGNEDPSSDRDGWQGLSGKVFANMEKNGRRCESVLTTADQNFFTN